MGAEHYGRAVSAREARTIAGQDGAAAGVHIDRRFALRGPTHRSATSPRRTDVALAPTGHSRILGPRMRLPLAGCPGRLLMCFMALLWLASGEPARAAWHSQEQIPVESPVYRLVDDLSASYAISSGLLLTRPWTRAGLGRFLDQLVADVPAAAGDPALLRLRRELEPGGGVAGLEPAITSEQGETSFELSPYARASYAEDRSRDRVIRDYRVGAQASFAFGERGLLFADGYAGNVTPGPHGTPDDDGSFVSASSDVTAWFDRAYASWTTRGFTVSAGHTWLEWGPGVDGTLGLSDGAPAFDVLQASVALPGETRLHWFVATLDAAGETYLAGHRLALRAGPSVELSFSELARFDGSGSAPLYMIPVMPYALMDRRVRGASDLPADSLERLGRNNVLYTMDFSWTWRPGTRFYGELMVDDATLDNSRPLAFGWQAGLHLRRFMRGDAWTLRGDFSRVYAYAYSVSHKHDFAHAGFPTAFPLGPDVEQFTARLEWRPDPVWAWGVEGSAVREGARRLGQPWQPGTPVPTRLVLAFPLDQDQRLALTSDWSPSPSVAVSLAGGKAWAHSREHVYLDDADGIFGRAQASFRW